MEIQSYPVWQPPLIVATRIGEHNVKHYTMGNKRKQMGSTLSFGEKMELNMILHNILIFLKLNFGEEMELNPVIHDILIY